MPVIRVCPFCRKGFLKSTYQMIQHVETKHASTVLRNSKSFNTIVSTPHEVAESEEKDSHDWGKVTEIPNTNTNTNTSFVGDGKTLYKGKYGNSLYEPADMFNPLKSVSTVSLDVKNLIKSTKSDNTVDTCIKENPLHFNY